MVYIRPLILEYGGAKVQFNDFKSFKVTHEPTGEVAYSINGTPLDSGIQYEEHRIWEFDAYNISRADRNKIEMMVQAQNKARRIWTPTQDYKIRLHDWIEHYQEPGTNRSRALAIRGNNIQAPITQVLDESNTVGISYPAQWNVRFLNRPEWEDTRTNMSIFCAKITLKELDRVFP